VLIAEMPENERTNRPRNVANTKRGERRDDTDLRVVRREEKVRKHQRRGLCVDEEVVVLEGTAYPATCGCLLRRLGEFRGFVRTLRLKNFVLHD
jgi:hypothetical protein